MKNVKLKEYLVVNSTNSPRRKKYFHGGKLCEFNNLNVCLPFQSFWSLLAVNFLLVEDVMYSVFLLYVLEVEEYLVSFTGLFITMTAI